MNLATKRFSPAQILSLLILIAGAAVVLVPLLWTFFTSLKTPAEVFKDNFLPEKWLWSNYSDAVQAIPFFNFLLNTLTILVPVLIGTVFSLHCVLTALPDFVLREKRRCSWCCSRR